MQKTSLNKGNEAGIHVGWEWKGWASGKKVAKVVLALEACKSVSWLNTLSPQIKRVDEIPTRVGITM